jgi:Lysylphosphatidylglycerol synthase TM region
VSLQVKNLQPETPNINQKHINRLKFFGILLTVLGISLFVIYSVGVHEILDGIAKIGAVGFVVILILYLFRICVRATAWKLSVHAPYKLEFKDTFQAVIIGEAVSSMIPLGILASGTAKAIAVRNRIPLVVGLSSVATENLFYTFITSLFIIAGAVAFLFSFTGDEAWIWTIYTLISLTSALLMFCFLLILRQWHLASGFCQWLYEKGVFRRILENGHLQVRLFENLIFNFYRSYPNRFAPIILCQILFHALGIAEVWFILSRISDAFPNFYDSFLLESVSRVVTITFKLIPFAIGVDEASSQFISENLALGVAVGVTIAILRKGRILFWAIIGVLIILKRNLNFSEILRHNHGIQSERDAEKRVVSTSQID